MGSHTEAEMSTSMNLLHIFRNRSEVFKIRATNFVKVAFSRPKVCHKNSVVDLPIPPAFWRLLNHFWFPY